MVVKIGENKAVNLSIIFIAIVLLAVVLRTLQGFLKPFVFAVILSFLIMPLVRSAKKKGVPSWLTLVLFIVVFFLVIIGFGFLLQDNIASIAESTQYNGVANGSALIFSNLGNVNLGGKSVDLNKFIDSEKIGSFVVGLVSAGANSLLGLGSSLFLVLIFLIFIIPSYDLILGNIEKAMDSSGAKRFRASVSKIENHTKEYLKIKTLISLGTALVSAAVLFFFNVDLIVVFALMIFVLNFIPNIGSFIGVGVILVFYALTAGIGTSFLTLAISLIIVQIIFGNILDPKLSGRKLTISPLVILLLLLFWGWVWGVVGMLLSVPLTTIIKIMLEEGKSTKGIAEAMS